MLLFFVGAICFMFGLAVSVLIAIAVIFFRKPIEAKVQEVMREVESKSNQVFDSGGFVFEPPSEEDEAREQIIEKNNQRGASTKITELL